MPLSLGEQPTRLRILWGASPLSSIARFGRLAYLTYREVTNCTLLRWKSHGCPVKEVHARGGTRRARILRVQELAASSHSGRSDRGGEQTCGPQAKRMTAVPKFGSVLKLLYGEMRSADLVLTWGRPKSEGKKRVNAPSEPPG